MIIMMYNVIDLNQIPTLTPDYCLSINYEILILH